MANAKRSKKAASPPPPVGASKQPRVAKRTESPADTRVKGGLQRGGIRRISAHVKSASKRRQAKRDKG
ncbi:MAG TPA: hypothetical protein VFQ02_05835 [Nitrospira sp.]|nr:hypothetical protein [Nitrospira sp.]